MGSGVATGRSESERSALRLRDIVKSFGETHALRGVSFDINGGEIHALLGGNGSGKSTLVKILAGVHQADAGSIQVQGEELDAHKMTPSEADGLGLRFVHQQPSIFPEMTVAENLSLGRGFETGPAANIRWRQVNRRARIVLERFGIDVHPGQQLSTLTPADRTMVEIARALQDQEGSTDGVLVLDEPTASLPAPEVDLLLEALRRYAEEGQTIIYVTHRLEEVLGIADRVTVLRDGEHTATEPVSAITHDDLVELICGRFVGSVYPEASTRTEGEVVLELRGLTGGPVRPVDLTVRAGEIVGLAGLVGSGRTSLLRLIFGDLPVVTGEIKIAGYTVAPASPKEAMRMGVAYVPESRADAAFEEMTVAENLSVASVKYYWRNGYFHHRAERDDTWRLMDVYGVKAASPSAAFGSLSGGNQQKAILGRWLRRKPRLLLLDEPTHGVDVGARVEIYSTIRQAADRGASVVIASSDFDELAGLCDRVVVVADGRVVAEAEGGELDSTRLQELAYVEGAVK